jgi:hypothetical protein
MRKPFQNVSDEEQKHIDDRAQAALEDLAHNHCYIPYTTCQELAHFSTLSHTLYKMCIHLHELTGDERFKGIADALQVKENNNANAMV